MGYEATAAMRHFEKLLREAAEENGRRKVQALVNSKLDERYRSVTRSNDNKTSRITKGVTTEEEELRVIANLQIERNGGTNNCSNGENDANNNDGSSVNTGEDYIAELIPLERYLAARKALLGIYRNKYSIDDTPFENYLVERWNHESELFKEQLGGDFNTASFISTKT